MKNIHNIVPPDISSLLVQILGKPHILDLSGVEQETLFGAGTTRILISVISNQ
jgi:hypothetical protein